MIKATKSQLDQAVQRLVNEFKPNKIILFGSHAWGTPDENGDVDILIIVPTSEIPPTRRASRAYRSLQGLKIPFEIIVSTQKEIERYRHVPASLTRKILEKGQVICG